MKDRELERLLREHYKRELTRARQGVDAGSQFKRRPVEPETENREWLQYIAAAAALAALPVLLLFSRPAIGPLAGVIDQEWRSGGRASVESALLGARDALLIRPGGAAPPVPDEEESR